MSNVIDKMQEITAHISRLYRPTSTPSVWAYVPFAYIVALASKIQPRVEIHGCIFVVDPDRLLEKLSEIPDPKSRADAFDAINRFEQALEQSLL